MVRASIAVKVNFSNAIVHKEAEIFFHAFPFFLLGKPHFLCENSQMIFILISIFQDYIFYVLPKQMSFSEPGKIKIE